MKEPTRRETAGLILLLSSVTLITGAFCLRQFRLASAAPLTLKNLPPLPNASAPVASPAPTVASAEIVVHVAGAVRRPSVYHLPQGARGEDALKAAGGVLPNGDANAVNLAARLEDGTRLEVPFQGAEPPPAKAPSAKASHAAPRGKKVPAHPVDLNHASAEALRSLPGVGEKTAQRILEFRAAHGAFREPSELMQVRGIGPKLFAKLRPYLQTH